MAQSYYVAEVAVGAGDGSSEANAADSLAGLTWAVDTSVFFKRGDTIEINPGGREGINVPDFDGALLTYWGEAEAPPRIMGATELTAGWSLVGSGVYSRTANDNVGVCLFEDQPMILVDHNIASWQTILEGIDGGFAIDGTGASPTLYVRLPSGVDPAGGGCRVSDTQIGIEHNTGIDIDNFRIIGLEILGYGRQGINLSGVTNGVVGENTIRACGGDREPSFYLGGGLQIVHGCNGIDVYNNDIYDCYDSPFSPQIPAGNNGTLINNITYRGNRVTGGFGLAAFELAIWSTTSTIQNITIENNIITYVEGWQRFSDGPRGPVGVILNSGLGNAPGNEFNNINIHDNKFINIPGGGIQLEHARCTSAVVIARNEIVNCGAGGARTPSGVGSVTGVGGIDIATSASISQDIDITHNLIRDCTNGGINYAANNATAAGEILNNTLVDNGTNNIDIVGNNSLPIVKRNISSGGAIAQSGSGSFTEDYNNSPTYTGFTKGANSTTTSPGFVDSSLDNYELAVGSAQIGAGDAVTGTDRRAYAYLTNDLGAFAHRTGLVNLAALSLPGLKTRNLKDPSRNHWAMAGTNNNKDAPFVRDTITLTNMSCLIVRYYWVEFEPTAGTYDFSLVSGLLDACAGKKTFLKILPMWRNFNTGLGDVMPADLVAANQFSAAGGFNSPVYETDVRTRYQDMCKALVDEYKNHPWFAGIQTNETAGQLNSPTDTYTKTKLETEMKALFTALSAHCPYIYTDFYWNFINGSANVTTAGTSWDNIFNGLENELNVRLVTPDIVASPASVYGAINNRVYPFFNANYEGSVGYFGGIPDGAGVSHIIQNFVIGSSMQFDSYRWNESGRTLLELYNFAIDHLLCQFVVWTWTSQTQGGVTLEYEDNGEGLANTAVLIAAGAPAFSKVRTRMSLYGGIGTPIGDYSGKSLKVPLDISGTASIETITVSGLVNINFTLELGVRTSYVINEHRYSIVPYEHRSSVVPHEHKVVLTNNDEVSIVSEDD